MEQQLLDFLKFLEDEFKYSKNTIAAYKNDLTQFLHFILEQQGDGLQEWGQVSDENVQAYVAFMKQQPYASSSIARKVAAVKSFFNHLFSREQIDHNPTIEIESPKVKKRLPQTLSFDEVERLLKAPTRKKSPKHLRDTALLTLLYSTGMRVTEVVSLELSDVNLAKSLLHSPVKDGNARELPFDDSTKQVLHTYLEHGRPYLAKDNREQSLFLNHRGQQLTRQGLWLIIKAYAKQVNLTTSVTPHTLRHSFAAHKLYTGSDLQEVQKLLGHANISTTQIYTQIAGSDEEEE
ncbi:MAG: tyrosine recombinase [Anaerolineales bacterium]|nr:tyrosine recombinase [Anaerolineales bacterium]